MLYTMARRGLLPVVVVLFVAFCDVIAVEKSTSGIKLSSPSDRRIDVEMPEELPVGTVVVGNVLRESGSRVSGSKDAAERMQFDVVAGSLREHFRVDAETGSLVIVRVIDRDFICSGKYVFMSCV